jgi:DNA-directed RNA polymerase subunit delta
MARVRMTSRRRAATPPANPRETPDHPAFEPDPEVSDYGMNSDFAETPTSGPYPNSAHPATPDEGPSDHPAAKKAARAKSARQRRRAAERKAAKCIRLAQSMFGPTATTAQVEDQAVDFMDMSDKAINTALRRLSNSFLSEDQNDPDGETQAPMGVPVIQSDPMAEMQMMSDHDIEAEELLALMLAEEAPEAPAVPAAPAMESPMPAMMEEPMADEVPIQAVGDLVLSPMGEDPMGLDAAPATDDILAELFGGGHMAADEEADDEEDDDDEEASKSAADEEADDEEADDEEADDEEGASKSAKSSDDEEADDEEADDEEADEEASKKSASKQRPRGRKASKGAKTLGAVTKAAAKGEISDLSKLWETAPDVSDVFGV